MALNLAFYTLSKSDQFFPPNLLGSSKSAGKSTGLYKHVLEFTACFGPPSPRTVSEQQRDHIERDLKLELKFPLETL